jgi:SAM-dependent methyltransferase
MPGKLVYDLLYRTGAARRRRGWEVGVGPELKRLVDDGVATPEALGGNRAVDLGCGIGTNVIFLAGIGFDATGVDFSAAAVDQARAAATGAGVEARFVVGDVTRTIDGLDPPFDLILLYNVVQDLDADGRRGLAEETRRLSRPGAVVFMWCWYGRKAELPLVSYRGPSRLAPFVVEPGEERDLFGEAFDYFRPDQQPGGRKAVFLLTRR